ncbi:hypothetical protein [Sandaracinobacteroides saxicola]|uniref:Uncharacterized protein n=1 Tax=Sandaracinobacteroides saxicola TaxID=2759707 RepID=A0A7G5IJU3_9SPHN|nr:hypothetical protein [Sandaracinobacteroides saxicola]QMW23635.1 hypothetical protein H3309_03860 [Sandaracinobacteroides saxicola]
MLALLIAAPALSAPVELVADPAPVTNIVIKRTTLPARVSLAFDRALVLSLADATAARLRAFPLIGKRTVTGNLIPGGSAVFRGNFYSVSVAGTKAGSTPTVWVDKRFDAKHDAVVSVMAIDAPRVLIRQPRAPAGGATIVIPRGGTGDAQAWANIGGERIRVSLDLETKTTIMNARAAAALEGEGLLKRGGTVGLWEPVPGVALPYERMRVTPGASFMWLPLVAPVARISEERAKLLDARAKAGTTAAEDEADTIVVTAKKERGRAPWLIIGMDVLGKCGSIELDRPGKRWVLTCDFAG